MNKFKIGDRVVMKCGKEFGFRTAHGEVTIVRGDNSVKVIFDEDWAPNYDDYPIEELELSE